MRIDIIRPAELDAALRARWHVIRHASGQRHLHSPFFAPEFAELIGQVRTGARVAVIEVDGDIAGFFAFERNRLGSAGPLGARMSDGHGPVLDARAGIEPGKLVRGCGLLGWRFDHLPAGQPGFDRFETSRARAWLIRLDQGFEAYRAEIDQRTSWMRRNQAKLRRLERQFGPLRFEARTLDAMPFERLARWKSDQYIRTGQVDNFAIPWIREYLDRLRHVASPALTGMMSTLHAGDRLVAVHLGMRSERVWHHYLPTYDRELSSHSPGLCLLHRMAETAPELGLDTIDFSSGDMDYKLAVSNEQVELAQGSVEPAPMRALRRGATATVGRMRSVPWVLQAARWSRRRVIDQVNSMR